MIKTKNLFMLFTVLFVILFMCSYSFADFVVGLDGIKVPQDIIEAQGAGFNAVTVSPDSPIQDLSDKVIKSGLSICVPDTQCKKINLVNDKKILKKDSLRFLSYDAIIDGTTMLLYTSFYLEDTICRF